MTLEMHRAGCGVDEVDEHALRLEVVGLEVGTMVGLALVGLEVVGLDDGR